MTPTCTSTPTATRRPDGLAVVPTIVVLHGGPGRSAMRWDRRPRDLAQLVLIDLRGQGLGKVPSNVHAGTDGDDVVAFMGLGLERPILFGHSAGGFVASRRSACPRRSVG